MKDLPNGGKVVIVDDCFQEILPLINILNRNTIPVSYYTGKTSELPIVPLQGVRLFFLDLRFSPHIDAKTIVSNACNILKTILGENNGPYLLIIWSSTGNDYKEELEKSLENEKYRPEFILFLSKADYFQTEVSNIFEAIEDVEKILKNAGIENCDDIMDKISERLIMDADESKKVFISSSMDKLQQELYEGLSSVGLLSLFILWENTVRNSAHKVVNEVYSQIPTSIPVEKKLPAMAYYLAKKRLEKQFENVEDRDKLYAALNELNELYIYFYSEDVLDISVDDFLPMNIQRNTELVPSQARFNSWKLITTKGKLNEPGNIYKDTDKTFEFFKMIREYGNDDKYKEWVERLKLDERLLYIKANINGECETAQSKYPVIRVLPGVLIPCEVYDEYEDSGVLKSIKSHIADYIFNEFESFEYDQKEYYMLFNINQCTYIDKGVLESSSVYFKLQRKYYLKLRQSIAADFSKQGLDLYR